jgi:hypothetical protein
MQLTFMVIINCALNRIDINTVLPLDIPRV